jgi:hypothetical protein
MEDSKCINKCKKYEKCSLCGKSITEIEDERFLDESILIVNKIAYWARRYPELYQPGDARNTIANHLAQLFTRLDELRKKDN